jgi:drug/metabolite transporter (DMT)-like permease
VWLLSAVVIWGGNAVASKLLMEVVPALDVFYLRMIVGAVLLWAISLALPAESEERARPPLRLFLALGVLLALQNATFFLGLHLTTADISSLLSNTGPLWTALLLGSCGLQFFHRRNFLGFFLALGGTALMILTRRQVTVAYAPAPTAGAMFSLISAIFFGAYIVVAKGPIEKYGGLRILTGAYLVSAVLVLPLAVVRVGHVPWGQMTPLLWGMLSYSVALAGGWAFAVWYVAMRFANTTRAVLYLYLVPLFAALAAWLCLGEVLSPGQVLGIAVTLLGVYLARPPLPHHLEKTHG